jgi:hypothetical protein
VYKPEVEIVPTVALPPAAPFTCQVTAVLLVFCTLAVNCCVAPAVTVAEVGEMVMLTAGGAFFSVVADGTPQPTAANTPAVAAASNAQLASRLTVFRASARRGILIEVQAPTVDCSPLQRGRECGLLDLVVVLRACGGVTTAHTVGEASIRAPLGGILELLVHMNIYRPTE